MSLQRMFAAMRDGATPSQAAHSAVLWKKGGSTSTQTIQQADPWVGQQPYLRDIFAQAQQNYYNKVPTYFEGQQTAAFTPEQLQAQQQLRDVAATQLPQQAQGAVQAQNFAYNAPDVLQNPAVQQLIDTSSNRLIQNLTERLMPQIRGGAVQAGQYGGSRQGIAEGLALRGTQQAIGETTADILNKAYAEGLDAQTKALALAPQTTQLITQPAQVLGAVGEQQQAYEQALINEAVARHDFEQNLAANQLANYQNIIQGNYGGSSTSTSSGGGGGFGSAIGGALSGYSLASSAVSGLGLTGGLATALPWVGGALGLLSFL